MTARLLTRRWANCWMAVGCRTPPRAPGFKFVLMCVTGSILIMAGYSFSLPTAKAQPMLTVADVHLFLNAQKRAVSVLDWRPGLSKKDTLWWSWDCAIETGGTVPEGARIIMQCRQGIGAASTKYSCGLLYRTERVYAIDFDPDGQHTNKVGLGRPYYGKRFGPGTHEHTWSEDGAGYAEPIQDFADFALLFAHVCANAMVRVDGGFKPPPSQQLSLELI